MGNKISKQKKHNQTYSKEVVIDYILCYWFRKNVINKTITSSFPNEIKQILQKLYGQYMDDGLIGKYSGDDGFRLEVKDDGTFTLRFSRYHDPDEPEYLMEYIPPPSRGHYQVSGTFTGDVITKDQSTAVWTPRFLGTFWANLWE
eukprot:901059_1